MGLFDQMFGRGASAAQQDPNAQPRFNQLKGKYQSVLNMIEQQQVQLQNLHVQDNKLFIRGSAPTQEAKDSVWNQIKLVDAGYDQDLTVDITLDTSRAVGAAAGGGEGQGSQRYEVKGGDTLSRISKQFYGDPNQYMRIFYANQDKLRHPDKIQVGQELTIPPDEQ